jgi:hypothetical protein
MDLFEVVRTLGRGAFASVFYVRQKADGEDLVVKKFHRPMDELSPKERQEVRGWLVVQAWGYVGVWYSGASFCGGCAPLS